MELLKLHPHESSRRWRFSRLVFGLLLLTFAALKLAALGTPAFPVAGWFSTPMVQLAAAEWELVLGIWLLSGVYPIGAWLVALVTFLVFSCVSFSLGWIGQVSCGCLGTIEASPWHAFAIDFILMVALLMCRPIFAWRQLFSRFELKPPGWKALGYVPAIAVGCAAIVAVWLSARPGGWLSRLPGKAVFVTPSYTDLGAGEPGQTLQTTGSSA